MDEPGQCQSVTEPGWAWTCGGTHRVVRDKSQSQRKPKKAKAKAKTTPSRTASKQELIKLSLLVGRSLSNNNNHHHHHHHPVQCSTQLKSESNGGRKTHSTTPQLCDFSTPRLHQQDAPTCPTATSPRRATDRPPIIQKEVCAALTVCYYCTLTLHTLYALLNFTLNNTNGCGEYVLGLGLNCIRVCMCCTLTYLDH